MSRPLLHSVSHTPAALRVDFIKSSPKRGTKVSKTLPVANSLAGFGMWVGLVGLVVGLVGGVYLVGWKWWVVKTIHCQTSSLEPLACPFAQALLHQPLLTLDVTAPQWSKLAVAQDEQQRWWYIESWSKQLPSTVNLTYAQSQPKYQLTQDGQTWWLVTEVGLGQTLATSAAELPVSIQASWSATVTRPVLSDQRVDPQLHDWVLAMQTAVKAQPDTLQKINFIDQFTAELVWPNWIAVVSPDQEPAQQITKLKQVQSTLAEKTQTLGKDFQKVDLRFRFPVLESKVGQQKDLSEKAQPVATQSAVTPSVRPSASPAAAKSATPSKTLSTTSSPTASRTH